MNKKQPQKAKKKPAKQKATKAKPTPRTATTTKALSVNVLASGKKFTVKETLFINYYVTNGWNGTQAALSAGYSANSAAEIAWENLRKPRIKAEIDRIIAEKLMSREEVLDKMSNMARSSLNDYTRIVEKPHIPMTKVGLNVCISHLLQKIEDEQEFLRRMGITAGPRLIAAETQRTMWEEEIVRLQIELDRNPGAYRLLPGQEIMIEVVEIDLVKLARDKERGIIKKFKVDKNGEVEVELYSAENAVINLGKVHGVFEKDNQRINWNSEPLTVDDIKKLGATLEDEY